MAMIPFRQSVQRKLESSESMVLVMVLHSGRWWRKLKSPSTANTPALSAARKPWSELVLESGVANDARESLLEEHGFMLRPQPLQFDQQSDAWERWTFKKLTINSIKCEWIIIKKSLIDNFSIKGKKGSVILV